MQEGAQCKREAPSLPGGWQPPITRGGKADKPRLALAFDHLCARRDNPEKTRFDLGHSQYGGGGAGPLSADHVSVFTVLPDLELLRVAP
jgi:hypothetical protein